MSATERHDDDATRSGGLGAWLGLHVLGAALFALLAWSPDAAPAASSPALEKLDDELAARAPDVVFVGNSMVADGVHAPLLRSLIGPDLDVVVHAEAGTYTAYWYLVLAHHVLAHEPPPRLVVLVFRDPLLTYATLMTQGDGARHLAAAHAGADPVLERVLLENTVAAPGLGERARLWLRTHVPLWGGRDDIQRDAFDALKRAPARALPWLPPYEDAARAVLPSRAADGQPFPVDWLADAGARGLGAALATPAGDALALEDYFRFERVVDRSLLPELVRVCRDAGTELLLVRFKKGFEHDWTDLIPRAQLDAYRGALDAWCAARDVPLVDLHDDPHLASWMYRGEDHLNEFGREHLTARLAQVLEAWETFAGAGARDDDGAVLGERREAFERAARAILEAPLDTQLARSRVVFEIPNERVEPARGLMFRVALPARFAADGDIALEPYRSRWELYEDGRRLPRPHTPEEEIVLLGKGRYRHRDAELLFATSDGSSPRENGRRYVLVLESLTLKR